MTQWDRARKRFETVPLTVTVNHCWEWGGGRDRGGYGNFTGLGTKGAHRIAWMLSTGRRPPNGMVIMHTCDNPPCVNPAHLRLGTYKDNTQDMMRKGRHSNEKGHRTPRW